MEANLPFVIDVFLSSTAEDLVDYSDAVYERLRGIDVFRCTHQRNFGACDASTVDYCRERVRKAELFVGIIGMRRGWEPDGDNRKRSITEMEHDWAKEAGRRRFLYVTPEHFPIPGHLHETKAKHNRQLAFRKRVMADGDIIVEQKRFDSSGSLASAIVEKLFLHVATGNLITLLRPELSVQHAPSTEEHRPAIAAAVERLAEDEDVDLLALARNPRNVDLADLEAKLRARAEAQEILGRTALKTGAEYWRHIGALAFPHNTRKALGAYEKAVALDPHDPEGWRYLGELQYRLGDLTSADRSFARLLELGKSAGDPRTQSMGCVRLGWIALQSGDLQSAEALISDAVRFAEAAAWQEGTARAYVNLGNIYWTRGDLEKAEEMHRRALVLNEALGHKDGMAAAYSNLGAIHLTRGELDQAEETQLKALMLSEELNRKEGMARLQQSRNHPRDPWRA
jgi:tetratricopeptide (TPR) repeat protein